MKFHAYLLIFQDAWEILGLILCGKMGCSQITYFFGGWRVVHLFLLSLFVDFPSQGIYLPLQFLENSCKLRFGTKQQQNHENTE